MDRIYGVLSEEQQPRWRRVGHDIYRTVGGYVTGNLLISLIAGVASGIVLWIAGVPYVVALGLLVDWRQNRRGQVVPASGAA